jgi:hypothetical protein
MYSEPQIALNETRLCRKTPSSARERAVFSPGKDGEAGDVCFIVDTAGCSQVEKGPLEARSGFPTEPSIKTVSLSNFVIRASIFLWMYTLILQPRVEVKTNGQFKEL